MLMYWVLKHSCTHSRTHVACENILREISVCCWGLSDGPDRRAFCLSHIDSLLAFVTGTQTIGADTEVCSHWPYNGGKHPDRRVKMQVIFNEIKLSVIDWRDTLRKRLTINLTMGIREHFDLLSHHTYLYQSWYYWYIYIILHLLRDTKYMFPYIDLFVADRHNIKTDRHK